MKTTGKILVVAGIALMLVFIAQGYWLGLLLAGLPIVLGLLWVRVATEREAEGKPARGTD
jgi:hypothetical protein